MIMFPCKICGKYLSSKGERFLSTHKGLIEVLCWRCLHWARTGKIAPEIR